MSTKVKKEVTATFPTLRELVDAGAHFGHRRSRSHPSARQFVYTIRDKVLVINLEDTVARLREAAAAAGHWAAEGKTFLFVGTKPQAAEAVKAAAERCGMPYITQRWLGGTLTNYATIRRNLDKLARLDEVAASPEFEAFTKKERVGLTRTRDKLAKMFGGIASLSKIPDILVVIDLDQEKIAVGEANKLSLPIIGLVDTNVDPGLVTYPIPANDDSRRTIELILNQLSEAITQGVALIPTSIASPAAAEPTPKPVEKSDQSEPATKADQMARDLEVRDTSHESRVQESVSTSDTPAKPIKTTAKKKATAKSIKKTTKSN